MKRVANRRTVQKGIWLHASEMEQIQKKAALAGLDVAVFIRQAALARKIEAATPPALAEAWAICSLWLVFATELRSAIDRDASIKSIMLGLDELLENTRSLMLALAQRPE